MQSFIAEIDLPRFVLDNGFTLKKHKETHWAGNTCPECGAGTEQSTRLSVFVGRDNYWHWQCFACGAHGDAADFLAAADGVSLADALKQLDGGTAKHDRKIVRRAVPQSSTVHDAEQTAAISRVVSTLLHDADDSGPRAYLRARGLTDATIDMAVNCNELRMLPSNAGDARHWLFQHVGKSTLHAAGMLHAESEWPALAFRPLVAIPLAGRAMECRSIGANERDKDYSKALSYGRAQRPWYFSRGREPRRVLVTEGFIDALSAWQLAPESWAFIAVPGVSRWSAGWFKAFHAKHPRTTIAVGFDNDPPGKEAARKLGTELKALGITTVRRVPHAHKDWNDLLVQSQRKAA
ncbi:MAG TPA: toprim domain-containing protein [Rhodanobacteraceae bacterium]